MRSMCCTEHETKKNCCARRSCLPWISSSFGYRTLEMFSEATFSATAPTKSPVLKTSTENDSTASADHRRMVLAVLVRYPRIGVSTVLHFESVLRPRNLPGISQTQPLVRGLDLPSVADHLIEDAVFVADSVTNSGNVEGGQRIHEA